MEYEPFDYSKKYPKNKKKILKSAPKAYDNARFIHSRDGRIIRIISEYLYPEQHFKRYGIKNLIIFFGSARSLSGKDYERKIRDLAKVIAGEDGDRKKDLEKDMLSLQGKRLITDAYEGAVDLAERLTRWSLKLPKRNRFHICSGGGPGMMEAANKGATKAGGKSVGLNISLPFEQNPNQFITPEMNFEFHYFFMRKFWFVYMGRGLVVFPGGFGTMDEMMEVLTLKQTQKTSKPKPVLLYGSEFWKKLINFDYLVDMGMISKDDLDLFHYVDSPKEAFDYLTKELVRIYNIRL